MKVELRFIEPTEVVYYAYHKLQRIMGLKIKTLITLYGITGGMSF